MTFKVSSRCHSVYHLTYGPWQYLSETLRKIIEGSDRLNRLLKLVKGKNDGKQTPVELLSSLADYHELIRVVRRC